MKNLGTKFRSNRLDHFQFNRLSTWMCSITKHPMLSNFIQKPIGIITILGTAIGGPYAAFETDLGTQIRQSLVSRMGQPNPSNSGPLNSEPSDPYSLAAANTNNSNYSTTSFQPTSWNQPSARLKTSLRVFPIHLPMALLFRPYTGPQRFNP